MAGADYLSGILQALGQATAGYGMKKMEHEQALELEKERSKRPSLYDLIGSAVSNNKNNLIKVEDENGNRFLQDKTTGKFFDLEGNPL